MLAEAILAIKRAEGLRSFDMRRDLLPLADLIDLSFASQDAVARRSIVAEMRRVGRAGPLLWLVDAAASTIWPLMSGFVWIANGRLVGNVTLVPESGQGGSGIPSRASRVWTISNVAVHPNFRRQGIAHKLLEATLEEAGQRGADMVVLEVQTDNLPARQLYREFGFEVYDTVAELSLPVLKPADWRHPPAVKLRKRCPGDSPGIYQLFKAVTPATVQAVKPVFPQHYRMGIGLRLKRWLDDALYLRQRSDWILERDNDIAALLQITGQYTRAAHRLQVDVRPDQRGTLEEQLLAAGLRMLSSFPDREVVSSVSASHPEARQACHRAGFREIRVLDQMQLDLRHTPHRAQDGVPGSESLRT